MKKKRVLTSDMVREPAMSEIRSTVPIRTPPIWLTNWYRFPDLTTWSTMASKLGDFENLERLSWNKSFLREWKREETVSCC